MQPWRLLADPKGYIFAWLLGYSGGLGSIAGVLIVDYWVVRKKQLALADLYREQGAYTYKRGWNWRAVAATLLGCAAAWIGLAFDPSNPLHRLYDYAWFLGFGVAAITHWALMKTVPPEAISVAPATA
jgi:NCS1 family nucleobase:cation symporter-1